MKRAAFVLGCIASAFLAIVHSPPTSYVVERFAPSPEPSPSQFVSIRPQWPGAFGVKRWPGASWTPAWRPYRVAVEGGR